MLWGFTQTSKSLGHHLPSNPDYFCAVQLRLSAQVACSQHNDLTQQLPATSNTPTAPPVPSHPKTISLVVSSPSHWTLTEVIQLAASKGKEYTPAC